MKKFRLFIIAAVFGCFLAIPGHLQAADSVDLDPKSGEVEQPQSSREKYLKERIEAISKEANLTNEERDLVFAELNKYDNVRLKTWSETRKVYSDISRLGDNAKSEQYLKSYKKLQELTAQHHKASQDFMRALIDKLTPEKAFKVYMSYRQFNTKTGRQLRK